MKTEKILESSAIKVLNLMIDNKVAELTQYLHIIKGRVDRAYSQPGDISTRVSYEGSGREYVALPAATWEMQDLPDLFSEVKRLEKEVGELQRQKLRLFNDYDFTHGDTTQQKLVFGKPKKEK